MSQAAKAQEPSMEEILASIRRIIADDDANKVAKPPDPVVPAAAVPPRPAPPAPLPANNQSAIDAMMAVVEKSKAPTPAAPHPAPVQTDILDLTEAQATVPAHAASSSFLTIDGNSDVVFSDRAPDGAPEPVMRAIEEPRRPAMAPIADRSLLSNTAAAAVDSAFNSLAHTVLGNNARTLEDLVKEMLRPMLKSWLDDNLPGLVERIVRGEIERVARGRN